VLMLFLLTGQRISDVAKPGKQHIRRPEHVSELLRKTHAGRWLAFTQHKNRKRAPVTLVIPLLPLLEKVIEVSPCGSMTFIETEFGKPHTTKGLGNWFADRCVEADVPGRAHGFRKAGAHHRSREWRHALPAYGPSSAGKPWSRRSSTPKRCGSSSWLEGPCTSSASTRPGTKVTHLGRGWQ
jgi:integrase